MLPVTIDVMKLLGHTVSERIPVRTNLSELLLHANGVVFSRQDEARLLDLGHFEDTDVFEEIPHRTLSDDINPA